MGHMVTVNGIETPKIKYKHYLTKWEKKLREAEQIIFHAKTVLSNKDILRTGVVANVINKYQPLTPEK